MPLVHMASSASQQGLGCSVWRDSNSFDNGVPALLSSAFIEHHYRVQELPFIREGLLANKPLDHLTKKPCLRWVVHAFVVVRIRERLKLFELVVSEFSHNFSKN